MSNFSIKQYQPLNAYNCKHYNYLAKYCGVTVTPRLRVNEYNRLKYKSYFGFEMIYLVILA